MSNDSPLAARTKWFLENALTSGRCSTTLLEELNAHIVNRTVDIFQVIAEIATLEGAGGALPSRTKPAGQFRRRWLKGLWHKHYTHAGFIARNLQLHWTPDRLHILITEACAGRAFFDEQALQKISKGLVQDGYLQRGDASKLTGEWIVFATQDDLAYYLTLGTHTEKEEAIWMRCKACAAEFPDLKILRQDRG